MNNLTNAVCKELFNIDDYIFSNFRNDFNKKSLLKGTLIYKPEYFESFDHQTNTYNYDILVPGYKKEELNISTFGNYISIESNLKKDEIDQDSKKLKNNYLRKFKLAIYNELKFDKTRSIDAKLENGVLNLSIKIEENKKEKVEIEIK